MFAHGGLPLASLNPVNAFKGFPAGANGLAAGAAGIGIFFAFWSWVGFEMAPNYAEESRHPKKIVPRATYISVIGLGVFYTADHVGAVRRLPERARRAGPGADQLRRVLPAARPTRSSATGSAR